MEIDIKEITYHHNGVSGSGYHLVQFKHREEGVPLNMIAVVFEEPGNVAVFDRDLIGTGITQFFANTPGGDVFEQALRKAITKHSKRV
jgi:hypothetical protein